ncbi:hypothetical protein [Aerolutibacter daejeonensis]|nr:hypothetical protein [Lysobacter daejeonensis]
MWLCEGTYDIDWDAVSAVGTMLAVVVALWFSLADQRDRRRRDRTQSKIVATRIRDELADLKASLTSILAEFQDHERQNDFFDAMVAADPALRVRLVGDVSRLATPIIDGASDRMHVLPLAAATAVLHLVAEIGRLRRASRSVSELVGNGPDGAMDKAALLREALHAARKATDEADTACQRVLAN